MTATTAMVLGLPARVFAQTSGPGPIISALSAYMSAAGARALPGYPNHGVILPGNILLAFAPE